MAPSAAVVAEESKPSERANRQTAVRQRCQRPGQPIRRLSSLASGQGPQDGRPLPVVECWV